MLLLLGWLLAGCVDVTPDQGGGSLLEQQAVLEAKVTGTAIEQARQDLDSTAQVVAQQEQNQLAYERAMIPIYARETQLSLDQTQAALIRTQAAAQVTQTADSNKAESETLAKDMMKVTATVTVRRAENAALSEKVWAVVKPLIYLAFAIALALLLFFVPDKWVDHRISIEKQQGQKNSVFILTNGYVGYLEDGQIKTVLLGEDGNGKGKKEPHVIDGHWSDGKRIPKANTLGKVQGIDHTLTGQVIALVHKAINVVGPWKDQIPRWESMPGVSSSTWQRLTDIMDYNHLLEKGDTGTFLREDGPYANLNELLNALESGALVIEAPPLPVAGD